jgi:hypothetical protein
LGQPRLQAGLEFSATKDLDIVLHIEVLKPAFGTAFWEFVETGGYGIRESSEDLCFIGCEAPMHGVRRRAIL